MRGWEKWAGTDGNFHRLTSRRVRKFLAVHFKFDAKYLRRNDSLEHWASILLRSTAIEQFQTHFNKIDIKTDKILNHSTTPPSPMTQKKANFHFDFPVFSRVPFWSDRQHTTRFGQPERRRERLTNIMKLWLIRLNSLLNPSHAPGNYPQSRKNY